MDISSFREDAKFSTASAVKSALLIVVIFAVIGLVYWEQVLRRLRIRLGDSSLTSVSPAAAWTLLGCSVEFKSGECASRFCGGDELGLKVDAGCPCVRSRWSLLTCWFT